MTLIDWTQIEPQPLTLTLEKELGRNYIVLDADGDTVYMRSPDLWLCVRFMRAMALKKEAVVDERTIERIIDGTIGFSVRVPSSGGVPVAGADVLTSPVSLAAAPSGESATPPDTTRLRLVL